MRRVLVVWLAAFSLVACRSSGDMMEPGGGWDGLWSGLGDQGGFTYLVEITIIGSEHTIAYPTLMCGGPLTLVTDAGDRREFDENITTGGGPNGCVDGGRVVLVRSGDQMSYDWFFPSDLTQSAVTGTLTRQ